MKGKHFPTSESIEMLTDSRLRPRADAGLRDQLQRGARGATLLDEVGRPRSPTGYGGGREVSGPSDRDHWDDTEIHSFSVQVGPRFSDKWTVTVTPELVVLHEQTKSNLLGMSFLDRLENFEVRADRLVLNGHH
jgi:hypothetical protein